MAAKTTGKTVICLLRNDLRLCDNEVLHWSYNLKTAQYVLPVYCFDPRHFQGTYHFGLPKTGPHRTKFLLECVADLKSTLQKRGSDLLIRTGKPEVILPQLIKTIGQQNIQYLSYHEEVTDEELKVETSLKKCCEEYGIGVKTFWGHTLYHREDIPFSIDRLPDVYTQFRKQVEGQCRVRNVNQLGDHLKSLPPGVEIGEVPSNKDLGVADCALDSRAVLDFKGGETQALQRLQHYLWDSDKVSTYKETRNEMIGSDYSTKFSPWLSHGCISPRKIYWEIKNYEEARVSNQSTYWVTFELIWRDYFRYVALKYGKKIFFLEGIQNKKIPWKQDEKLFSAWKEGRTGVPFVDANMREMAATGFMSNRGRQNVASFLTKDLQLDWRMGAEWFESQLIDHDVTSNYGNWLYSAGLGNDPREDRKFNMVKQGLDYDPEGQYVRLWVPELSKVKGGSVHTVWTLSSSALSQAEVALGETYPHPVVIAPEWNRHMHKSKGGKGRGGARSQQGQKPGIDFYFKGST